MVTKRTKNSCLPLTMFVTLGLLLLPCSGFAVSTVDHYRVSVPVFTNSAFDQLNTLLVGLAEISGTVSYDSDDLTGVGDEVLGELDGTADLVSTIDSLFDSGGDAASFLDGALFSVNNWVKSIPGPTVSLSIEDFAGSPRAVGFDPSSGVFESVDISILEFRHEVLPAVPEPSTIVLMALGLVGLGYAGRRRLMS